MPAFTTSNLSTDQDLIEAIKAGEPHCSEAMRVLYGKPEYRRIVTSIVAKDRPNSGDDISEVYQESMLELMQKLRVPTFVLNGQLTSFFYGIASKKWGGFKRKKDNTHLEITIYEETTGDDTPDVVLEKELYRLWEKEYRKVSDACQQLFTLKEEGKNYEEIARITGYKDANVVKSKINQCRMKLRAQLEEKPFWASIIQIFLKK